MIEPRADGGHEPTSGREDEPVAGDSRLREWVTVLEFTRFKAQHAFLIEEVEGVLSHLREWHPSGLWHPDRYAVQFTVPAATPHEALRWAIAFHRQAAGAVGVDGAVLARVEVSTTEELEQAWQEHDRGDAPVGASENLLCGEVLAATRSLVGATTAEEVAAAVIGFARAAGGQCETGAPRHLEGTVDFDLTIDHLPPWHVSAENVSVTGLILEQSLPGLLDDARLALARICRLQYRSESLAVPHVPPPVPR